MEYKRVNWGFLLFLVLEIMMIVGLIFGVFDGIDIEDTLIGTVFSESTIFLAPTIVLIMGNRDCSLSDRLGLKSMKLSVLAMVFLYGIAIMPLGTLANGISMLWVDNVVLEESASILQDKWYVSLFATAIIAPLAEEYCFRAFMYNGYRRDGAGFSAVFLSSIAFAFMHMNFNQAAYALIVGIAFALIYEATGSFWSSFLCHLMFNAESIIVMFLEEHFYPGTYNDLSVDREELISEMPELIIAAIVGLVFAICFLLLTAKLSNRQENLKDLFTKREDRPRVITAPFVITLIMLLTYMILSEL